NDRRASPASWGRPGRLSGTLYATVADPRASVRPLRTSRARGATSVAATATPKSAPAAGLPKREAALTGQRALAARSVKGGAGRRARLVEGAVEPDVNLEPGQHVLLDLDGQAALGVADGATDDVGALQDFPV